MTLHSPRPTVASLLEQALTDGSGVGRFLLGLTDVGADLVLASTSCSIQLAGDERPGMRAESDRRARHCAEAERLLADGPAALAMAAGRTVVVDDQGHDDRWPAYRRAAIGEGVVSSMSTPLTTGGRQLGVITLYAPGPRDQRTHGLTDLLGLAGTAGDALGFVELLADPSRGSSGATTAARTHIDRAVGILIGSHACGPEEALEVLRELAERAGLPLDQEALQLIADTAAGPPPDDASPVW